VLFEAFIPFSPTKSYLTVLLADANVPLYGTNPTRFRDSAFPASSGSRNFPISIDKNLQMGIEHLM
jgi:hypothetical protein